MSQADIEALLAALKGNPQLREQLDAASSLEAALQIAGKAGFSISIEDWKRHDSNQPQDLSDHELEAVTGGTNVCFGTKSWDEQKEEAKDCFPTTNRM